MFSLDNVIDELRRALRSGGVPSVADVVRHAIRKPQLIDEVGSSRILHSEPGLTLVHTVVNGGFFSPPHDHRTWAVIGVYHGQENNTFYRLDAGSRIIEQCGGRELSEGEVLTLEPDAIHRIANPRQDKLIALHVYGRNIFAIERSAWDLTTGEERPFTLQIPRAAL
jgi:predicted metal-dependent enzyme (double-stranded beta helix superfamily)